MKKFDIPTQYRSNFIKEFKAKRKAEDPRKKDFSPTSVKFLRIEMLYARHFGFCYGVENAIEISYKAIQENKGKNIFLLSQMIHNPHVNQDLQDLGVRFILDTYGNQITPWSKVTKNDVVIIPAFGTTIEIEQRLEKMGLDIQKYNTTCPFVEKVWKTSKKLGQQDYTIIIHGKHKHEETRATFSHSSAYSASVVIKDIKEAKVLAEIMRGKRPSDDFHALFKGRYSEGFNPREDLNRIGVVNQTTMLATETAEIAEFFKQTIIEQHGSEDYKTYFADTRDTLCYATNDNQKSTLELLKQQADIAIVVGGYNSSNTTHLVELCEEQFNTFFISSATDILSANRIQHFDIHEKKTKITEQYFPDKKHPRVIMTSGASCPDSVMQEVTDKILSLHDF